MHFASQQRTAIGRTIIAAIIVVVLIVAAAAAVYFLTSSTSSTSTGSTTSTSSTTSGQVGTLTIDDETWPNGNLNQLYSIGAIPYPNWLDYTVYQSLVTANGNVLYANGTLKLLPMLAASWNSSASGDTWTFQLQQGVNFSNGDQFNAYQVWGAL